MQSNELFFIFKFISKLRRLKIGNILIVIFIRNAFNVCGVLSRILFKEFIQDLKSSLKRGNKNPIFMNWKKKSSIGKIKIKIVQNFAENIKLKILSVFRINVKRKDLPIFAFCLTAGGNFLNLIQV